MPKVEGLASFNRKMTQTIPAAVRKHLKSQMAVIADRIVATMESFVPQDEGDLLASIGWVWGTNIPTGAVAMTTVGSGDMVISIFAGSEETIVTNERGIEFQNAILQEGGTKDMPPSPYFNVSVRLNRNIRRSRIRKAIKAGLKEGAK